MDRVMAFLAMVAILSPGQIAKQQTAKSGAGSPTSYSRTSPHWPHLRTAMFSFRTIYIKDPAQQQLEAEWIADHMDHVVVEIGDGRTSRMVDRAEKKRNPRLISYVYGLNLTVFQKGANEGLGVGYYEDMQHWFERHREFSLENAFLHDDRTCPPPQPVSAGCRLEMTRWNSKRWVINAADSGAIAYQADRLARFAADQWNGVFLDEHESGGMIDANVCGEHAHTREYHGLADSCAGYFAGVSKMVAAERAALGPGRRLMLNIAEYASPFDLAMAVAGGGVQMELANNPLREVEGRWRFIDTLMARNVFAVYSPPSLDDFPPGYTRGNWATPSARWQLTELGNYYMVVPNPPDNLAFQNQHGPAAYSGYWTAAQEVDIGKPLGPRRVYLSGSDPAGQKYRIYIREFERAYVVVRPMILWSDKAFGDDSAVNLTLPGSGLVPLFANGQRGPLITRMALRHAEAAILLKP